MDKGISDCAKCYTAYEGALGYRVRGRCEDVTEATVGKVVRKGHFDYDIGASSQPWEDLGLGMCMRSRGGHQLGLFQDQGRALWGWSPGSKPEGGRRRGG